MNLIEHDVVYHHESRGDDPIGGDCVKFRDNNSLSPALCFQATSKCLAEVFDTFGTFAMVWQQGRIVLRTGWVSML